MKHYGVRNIQTKKFHRKGKVTEFFKDKQDAKDRRKELNGLVGAGEAKRENFNTGWRVTAQEIEV